MSRIVDALKKAAPPVPPGPVSGPSSKPLIFEKISFETPSADSVQREAFRSRLSGTEDERRRFLAVLVTLLAGSVLAAVWLWPKPAVDFSSPKIKELSVRVLRLEAALAQKEQEIDRLRSSAPPVPVPSAAGEELEAARSEIKALKRRLSLMLDDNLRKDEEITRLSARRASERIPG